MKFDIADPSSPQNYFLRLPKVVSQETAFSLINHITFSLGVKGKSDNVTTEFDVFLLRPSGKCHLDTAKF